MISIHKKVKIESSALGLDIAYRVHAEFDNDPSVAILNKINGKYKGASANSEIYSMVILGSRGMSSVESLIIGSISSYLLKWSPIPVVVVRNSIQEVMDYPKGKRGSFVESLLGLQLGGNKLGGSRSSVNNLTTFKSISKSNLAVMEN